MSWTEYSAASRLTDYHGAAAQRTLQRTHPRQLTLCVCDIMMGIASTCADRAVTSWRLHLDALSAQPGQITS
jgi:hypothetical protein